MLNDSYFPEEEKI